MGLLNLQDPLWPRVSAAFAGTQGPVPQGLTPDQFAQNAITQFIKTVVRKYESDVALQPTVDTMAQAAAKVDSDFTPELFVAVVAASGVI